jgi:acyl-CoA thioesterase I
VRNLRAIIDRAERLGRPLLVLGPTPVADDRHNQRIAGLSTGFRELCGQRAVPFVDAFAHLSESQVWMTEVTQGDGAHPGAAGYQLLAEAAFPAWREWLARRP